MGSAGELLGRLGADNRRLVFPVVKSDFPIESERVGAFDSKGKLTSISRPHPKTARSFRDDDRQARALLPSARLVLWYP